MGPSCVKFQTDIASDLKDMIRKKQDEFLDVYSLYLETGISWVKDELKLKAYELHLLDPAFDFAA